jgi:hypothetical protein
MSVRYTATYYDVMQARQQDTHHTQVFPVVPTVTCVCSGWFRFSGSVSMGSLCLSLFQG